MNLSFEHAPPDVLALVLAPQLPTQPSQKVLQSSTRRLNLGQYPELTTDDVRGALACLDPDCGYEEWVQTGMALHAGGYDFGLWDDWSKLGQKYMQGECAQKWNGFKGGGGITLGTLIQSATQNGWRKSNANPAQRPQARTLVDFPMHHWSDLHTLPKRKYLVKGLLDMGGMSVVYGPSNSGKTFFALDVSCHIALGWEWHGRKVKQGAVVYISAEGGLGIQERLAAFRIHHSLPSYGDVYVIPATVTLNKDQTQHEALINQIRPIKGLKLIVVDTLARAMGAGDENATAEMGALVAHCDAIREATGVHVLLVHHTGKDETRGARGSSALKGATDTEIYISQTQGVISVEVTKQREGKTGGLMAFTLATHCVGSDEDGESMYSCALAKTSQDQRRKALSGHAHRAYQVLCNLLIDKGYECVPKRGMKPQKVVRITDFKDDFNKAGIAETDNPDSLGKAFHRAKASLTNQQYACEWDGLIWLTDKQDTDGQS